MVCTRGVKFAWRGREFGGWAVHVGSGPEGDGVGLGGGRRHGGLPFARNTTPALLVMCVGGFHVRRATFGLR